MEAKLPGMPRADNQTIERLEIIRAALANLHRALSPLLELLPKGSRLQINQKFAGDRLTVTLTPGQEQ